MKVRHKNSLNVFDLSEPDFGKHWFAYYGYLTLGKDKVFFIYWDGEQVESVDLTDEFEFLKM